MAWSERMSKQKPSEQKTSERRSRGRAAGDFVADVGGQSFRRFGFVQSAVVSRWAEIVGERYAGVSCPESIRFPAGRKSGGVLTLLVEGAHSPLIQHLTPLIVERVNRFFGYEAINRIVFRQGRLPAATAKPKRARARPGAAGNRRWPARDRRPGASGLPRVARWANCRYQWNARGSAERRDRYSGDQTEQMTQ